VGDISTVLPVMLTALFPPAVFVTVIVPILLAVMLLEVAVPDTENVLLAAAKLPL
jgi:hypothetical protein